MAPLNRLHPHRPVYGVADPHKDHSLVLRTHKKARLAGRRVLLTPRKGFSHWRALDAAEPHQDPVFPGGRKTGLSMLTTPK